MHSSLRNLKRVCEEFDTYQVDTTGVQETGEITTESPAPLTVDVPVVIASEPEVPIMSVSQIALSLLSQVRLWHWQARERSVHVVLGDLYDSLDSSFDAFVEQNFGAFGVSYGSVEVTAEPYMSVDRVVSTLNDWIRRFSYDYEVFEGNPDIASVRDNIVSAIRKAVYLLSMQS